MRSWPFCTPPYAASRVMRSWSSCPPPPCCLQGHEKLVILRPGFTMRDMARAISELDVEEGSCSDHRDRQVCACVWVGGWVRETVTPRVVVGRGDDR